MNLKKNNFLIGCELTKENDSYVLTFPKIKEVKAQTKIYFKDWNKVVERMNELVGEQDG